MTTLRVRWLLWWDSLFNRRERTDTVGSFTCRRREGHRPPHATLTEHGNVRSVATWRTTT